MKRKLVLEFSKMNGAGNDFIVIDNRFYHFSDSDLSELAARLCPRRTGIGADGLLALNRGIEGIDFQMRYVNADGSFASMCGNGARCLALYAYLAGSDKSRLRMQTDDGVYDAVVANGPEPSVRLFLPGFSVNSLDLPITEEGRSIQACALRAGTEHAVVFTKDVAAVRVERWGRTIRNDPRLAPQGANVDFVQIDRIGGRDDAAGIIVRTYERGVEAETLACGTGAVAAALASFMKGRIATTTVRVQMPGGTLEVGFALTGDTVEDAYLEGPATLVFRGTREV